MTEFWRPVDGSPGYEVSDHGNVRSPHRRVLRPQPNGPYGYLSVQLGRARREYVHRLVADAFVGSVVGRDVDHRDGNPGNNQGEQPPRDDARREHGCSARAEEHLPPWSQLRRCPVAGERTAGVPDLQTDARPKPKPAGRLVSPRAEQLKTPSTYQTGWHSGPTPERCTGSVTVNDRTTLCAHPSHAEASTPVDDVVDAPELVTPTAFELSAAEPETPEWFAQRRDGITATDMPKILGLSRYGNALSVWLNKCGELPHEEAGEAAFWGQTLEDPIAREYVRRRNEADDDWQIIAKACGTLAHVERPWMRASPDRLIYDWNDDEVPPRPIGLLEVKNRNAYVSSTWCEGVPDDVLAQVVWQLLVTGLPWCDVAVLLGGNRLVVHRVTLQDDGIPEVAEFVQREAERVRQHVIDGTPPQVNSDEVLLALLERLYPDRTGQRELTADQTAVAVDLLDNYRHHRNAEKAAKTGARNAQAALVELLDDADTAIDAEGNELFSYRATRRRGYTVEDTTYRQIRYPKRSS